MQSSTTTFAVAVLAAALIVATACAALPSVADAKRESQGLKIRRELAESTPNATDCLMHSKETACDAYGSCEFLSGPQLCVGATLMCAEVTKETYDEDANNICNHLEYPGGESMCKWKRSKGICKSLPNPDPADCSEIIRKNACRRAIKKYNFTDGCYWNPAEMTCGELPETCDMVFDKSGCKHADKRYNLTDGCYWNPAEMTCSEVPEACDMVLDKFRCNKAMRILGIEDNCFWDKDANTCGIPMECSELSMGKCQKYYEYPKVVDTDGECKYKKEKGCLKKE